MNRRMLFLSTGFCIAALAGACSDAQGPRTNTNESTIASAYADLTLLSESARLGMLADTTRSYDLQADSLLHLYGLTRQEFESEFRELADDPDRSGPFFQAAAARIQALGNKRDSTARIR